MWFDAIARNQLQKVAPGFLYVSLRVMSCNGLLFFEEIHSRLFEDIPSPVAIFYSLEYYFIKEFDYCLEKSKKGENKKRLCN